MSMPFAATDRRLDTIAKLLPRTALAAFVEAANDAETLGLDWNGCIHAGWDIVKVKWHRPGGKGRYVRKDDPGGSDVHVNTPLGSEARREQDRKRRKQLKETIPMLDVLKTGETLVDFTFTAQIAKLGSDEQRVAYGWGSVISEGGVPVVDTQEHVISADEMVKAANSFMENVRLAKAMHEGDGVGEVIHSLPLTEELAKSLGIECDREGWIVGVKVHDDAVWKRVKDGELRAFSIGGQAILEPA